MKFNQILIAALLPVMAAISCTGQEDGPAVPEIVADKTVEVAPGGGLEQIQVSVVNYDGTSSLSASCDAAWVTAVQVAEDNASVSFGVAANATGEERRAVMVLAYPGAEDVSVELVQKASEQVPDDDVIDVTFDFEVLSAGPSKAQISIVPDDNEVGYLAYVMETSVYEQLEDDAAFVEAVVGYYGSLGDVASFVRKGTGFMEASGLTAGTRYTAAAFGYDASDGTAGAVSTCVFTTAEAPAPEDVSFSIEITEVTGNSVTARFTPDPVYYKYAVFAVKASERDSYGDDLGAWDVFVKGLADKFIESGAISSYEEYYDNSCPTEEFYVKIEGLEPGIEYYAGAILVDEHLNAVAVPSLSEKFRTPDKPADEPSVTLGSIEYFDGSEIAGKYPEYSAFSGKALVPVEVALENSSYWFVGAMDKSSYDLYLGTNYLEIALVQMNICTEKISSEDYPGESDLTHFFAIDWNRDMMVVGLAYSDESKAAKSDFATVHVNPQQSGAADIAEFGKYL